MHILLQGPIRIQSVRLAVTLVQRFAETVLCDQRSELLL